MFLLLPPVPGPKIRGIDSELLKVGFPQTSVSQLNATMLCLELTDWSLEPWLLFCLQKGKLRELTSILGSPLHLRPERCNNEPWVDFTHLDVEESTTGLTDLKPDLLVKASLASNCSPPTLSCRDHHSGLSCCEPDLPSEPEASTGPPPSPSQASDQTTEPSLLRGPGASGREASYTQVSQVRSSGKLLLSPELEQGSSNAVTETGGKDPNAFTSRHIAHPARSRDHESAAAPAPIYTLVDGIGGRNSLVLTPNASPGMIIPKNGPTPSGYLPPDLLGSITP